MKKTKALRLILFLVIGPLASCTMGRDYIRPDIKTPATWKAAERIASMGTAWPEQNWWKDFSAPELDRLVNAVLQNNYDIKAAMARIDQARALATIAGANLYPSLNFDAGISKDKKPGLGVSVTSHTVQLTANYELDIWGKYRRARESSFAKIKSSIYDWQGVTLTLAADVTSTYFQLLALNERLEIAHITVREEKRLIDIIEKRFRAGLISGLDMAIEKANLANVAATIPVIEQQRQQAENVLAVLLGKNPGELKVGSDSLMKIVIPPSVPAGLPSGLLERRPDVKQAEAELIAANADIGSAKAALFPSISLTAQGGYASQQLSTLISPNSTLYSLGANILAAIFQGYRLTGEYERTKARYDELLQNYHKAIISAFREVEDALVAIEKLIEQEKWQTDEADASKKAREISQIQYREGLIDFINVLNAHKTLLSAQNALVQTRLGRLNSLTSLYKALGGGWEGIEFGITGL